MKGELHQVRTPHFIISMLGTRNQSSAVDRSTGLVARPPGSKLCSIPGQRYLTSCKFLNLSVLLGLICQSVIVAELVCWAY